MHGRACRSSSMPTSAATCNVFTCVGFTSICPQWPRSMPTDSWPISRVRRCMPALTSTPPASGWALSTASCRATWPPLSASPTDWRSAAASMLTATVMPHASLPRRVGDRFAAMSASTPAAWPTAPVLRPTVCRWLISLSISPLRPLPAPSRPTAQAPTSCRPAPASMPWLTSTGCATTATTSTTSSSRPTSVAAASRSMPTAPIR